MGHSNMEASLNHVEMVVMTDHYRLGLLENTIGAVKQMALSAAQASMGGNVNSSSLIPCLTGAGFSAGSYSSPTTDTVTILNKAGPGSGFTSSGQTKTCYNCYNLTVGAGKLIFCALMGGDLIFIVGDC